MSQVSRKGERPASSPTLERELRVRKSARRGAPTEADRPPISTFPGTPPPVLEGQLQIEDAR